MDTHPDYADWPMRRLTLTIEAPKAGGLLLVPIVLRAIEAYASKLRDGSMGHDADETLDIVEQNEAPALIRVRAIASRGAADGEALRQACIRRSPEFAQFTMEQLRQRVTQSWLNGVMLEEIFARFGATPQAQTAQQMADELSEALEAQRTPSRASR